MKKILILAVISLVGAITAQAQTVSPVYLESKIGNKGTKGQFTITNNGVTSLPVVVEPKQLQVINGKATFGPLQPGTEVELKDTSAVVSPKSSRTFDYRVHCSQDCLVMFLNGMTTGQKTKEGVTIRLWIPSSVFLCKEQKGCRERTKKTAGLQ